MQRGEGIGAQLLGALEEQDAEHLSIVRAGHEKGVNELVLSVKQAAKREGEAIAKHWRVLERRRCVASTTRGCTSDRKGSSSRPSVR